MYFKFSFIIQMEDFLFLTEKIYFKATTCEEKLMQGFVNILYCILW